MTGYDEDVVAWAQEQAALLRSGRISEIDLANIAEEIEDVGKVRNAIWLRVVSPIFIAINSVFQCDH